MVFRVMLFILLMNENLYVYASGYDAYSSCYRKSRKKQELPCDFGKQNWCNIPGSAYPWHAVRRFVHENQGLMRRMYGDERHLSVLRAELENNDVEYFDSFAYRDEFRSRYSKDMHGARAFVKIFVGGEKKSPDNAEKKKSEKMRKSIDEKSTNILYHNHIKNSQEGELKSAAPLNVLGNKTSFKPLTTSTNAVKTTASEPTARPETITQLNDLLRQNVSTTTPDDATSSQLTSTMMDITTQSDMRVADLNFNVTTITKPDESELEEEGVDYSAETEDVMTTTGFDALTTTDDVEFEEEEGQNDGYQDVTEDEEEEEDVMDEKDAAEEPVSQQAPTMIRLKGINACPVKEEVVAPFWANNTRGEVLALLNLYPFEQYVHWEKCTFEHKQMFCREGCRCEQQYRLHRLLAYDPNNECRGIFSDWFRFPSCCVCKCYDIPMEFRLTSRSPRFKGREIYKRGPFKMFNHKNTP